LKVENCELTIDNSQLIIEIEIEIENGKWRMENGE
jgi:hypothetical protein